MQKAIISLSVDDGKENFLTLIQEKLLPLKIPATLYIITGLLDGSVENRGSKSLTIEQLQYLHKTGLFEIANHSNSHSNELEDIKLGHDKLCEWLGLDKSTPLGFASPGSGLKKQQISQMKTELEKIGVSYVRTEDSTHLTDPKGLRALYEQGDNSAYITLQDHAFKEKGDFGFSSLVLYKGVNDLKELKLLTDYAVEHGKNLTIMIHNLTRPDNPIYQNPWTFDIDVFEEYIDYIENLRAQNKLDILTVENSLKQ